MPDAGAADLARSGLPDAFSWWGEPGRPGWMPEAWMGTAYPPGLAGLVAGGWRLEEPDRAAAALPPPGVEIARSSLSWYDSLEVRTGGGAWSGFDAALASLAGTAPAGVRRGRSSFMLENGAHALEEYALTLARGDSLKDLGFDVLSGTLGAESGFESMGRHLWEGRARVVRGRHTFAGDFSQRGAAARLEDDEEEAASGQSGSVVWSYRGHDLIGRLAYERGRDRHESFGGPLFPSTREAQETRVAGEVLRSRRGREMAARVEWTGAKVTRFGDGAFERRAGSVWAAARGSAPLAGGRLELAVGLGRHNAIDRIEAAPSATFRMHASGANLTASIERMVTPVWSDVAVGADPFLQRAWVASIRAAAADTQGWRARGSLRTGRVYSRALADALPLEDLWLRAGLRAEAGTYDFALAEGGLARNARITEVGVEGFGLARRGIVLPAGTVRAPRTDPAAGFRAWLGAHSNFFGGDLHAGVRGVVEGVGSRESSFGALHRLPAFVTVSLEGTFSIGDVVIVVRARDLEDRTRELPWLDTATGLPATTGRPDVRVSLVWRLFN